MAEWTNTIIQGVLLGGLYALFAAVCQLSLAVGASTIMLASTPPGASTVAEDDCSCEHSAAVMCPMHRRPTSRPIPPGTPRAGFGR